MILSETKLYRPRRKADVADEESSRRRKAYRRVAELLNPNPAIEVLDGRGRPRHKTKNSRLKV